MCAHRGGGEAAELAVWGVLLAQGSLHTTRWGGGRPGEATVWASHSTNVTRGRTYKRAHPCCMTLEFSA